VVHSTAAQGCIHAAVTAKHLGIDFADTLFVVEAWPPSLWTSIADGQSIDSLRMLAITYMERKSVELADIVISPSHHMFRWMMRNGYDLPKERCFVHPVILAESHAAPENRTRGPKRIGELVFVGSFDARKGIGAFRRALDNLGDDLRGMTVTFIGEPSRDFSLKRDLLKSRPDLPFRMRVLDDTGLDDAVAYLSGEGRMAVMPPLIDGAPQILAACLNKGIPILVSPDGGAHEMIHEDDRPAAVCAFTPADLAQRIGAIVRDGAIPARPAIDANACRALWTEAHRALAEPFTRRRYGDVTARRTWNGVSTAPQDTGPDPLVSVCIVHFDRPAQLAMAVESVRQQAYRNIEIIVVDDGSTRPAAKAYLDRLERELSETGSGRVVRQANRYLGAARNAGIRNSTGAFIMMMDDDDLARPDEIETLVRAARFAGVDILCSYADTFTGPGLPSDGSQRHQRVAGLGDAISLGLFVNGLGGSRCLIRRRVFDALGGYTEDYGVGLDDHEFAMRAVLRGFKLMVLPRALYWYRASPRRLRDMHFDRLSGMARVFNAVLDNAPLCLNEALRFAQTLGRPDIAAARRKRGIVRAIRNRIAGIRFARLIRRS
jgi:glycosyltransferase involved in cell wall biosynthesis